MTQNMYQNGYWGQEGFALISHYDSLRFWYSDEFQDWALTAFILFAGL